MSDINTVWQPQISKGDYVIQGAALQSGADLYTAVVISLFTDRLADVDDQILDGSGNPRGWACDESSGPLIGSRLWLLERAKLPVDTLQRAQDYCQEALQWLLDDGVVSKVDISVALLSNSGVPNGIGITIVLYRQDGLKVPAMQFDYVWKQAFGLS
jgi:phage gp46-like protein